MITGRPGRSFFIALRVSRPFITGISMSSITTSGAAIAIFVSATSPLGAAPATSSDGSASMRSDRNLRMTTESSTSRTRFRAIVRLLSRAAAGHDEPRNMKPQASDVPSALP